jgi:hypothetical protein
LAVAALAALSLLPANASATHRGVGVVDEVLLELTYLASSLPGAPGQLTARLKVEGSPLAGMPVEFWREVDFLGPQRIVLGTVKTGADGTASVPLTLSESPLRVGARFAGDPEYLAAEETTEISSAGSAPTGSPVPTGNAGGANLDVIASVMPPLLALTVLGIWMLLIGVTVAAVLAIRRERSPLAATRKERM